MRVVVLPPGAVPTYRVLILSALPDRYNIHTWLTCQIDSRVGNDLDRTGAAWISQQPSASSEIRNTLTVLPIG